MKKKLSRTFQRAVASLLVCVMLTGCLGLPALAASVDSGSGGTEAPELKLWYDEPASQTVGGTNQTDIWQAGTLPIGNGDLGASVYGEIGTERLALNEKTLWTGGPSTKRPYYMGGNIVAGRGENGATIEAIQEKFLSGDAAGARNLTSKLTGGAEFSNSGYGYYAPWGELNIATAGVTAADAGTYQRWLSLDDALAGVKFESGGVTYTREYLASNPDNVLAVKLTASQSATFTISLLPSNETAGKSFSTELRTDNYGYTHTGEEDGRFDDSTAKNFTAVEGTDTLKLCGALDDNQLQFASYLKAVSGDGSVTADTDDNTLTVTGTEVTLFFSAATDYANVFKNPTTGDDYYYRTGETADQLAAQVKTVVDEAADKGYDGVKNEHLEDYHELYERMSLDLGQAAATKTTDALLAAYNGGTATAAERALLEVMLFQYGRYLTIASSREDSQLPSNLQGIWNTRTNPPWHSDFHTNVNLQINYWPTYVTNLTECADPLVRYVDSLREPGRITAEVYGGIEQNDAYDNGNGNGFMAHTQCTPWGWTCPGWSFSWGWGPATIAWILQNCWEYYEYTGDLEYMEEYIYPMMKEYVRLYEQLLVDINNDPDIVELASVPAYSPEHGPATMGNTFEQTLVWQLLEDTITAAQALGVDADKVGNESTPGTWKYIQSHLKGPIEIGTSGELKEWYDEVGLNPSGTAVDASGNTMGSGYGHRHLSHMLGLFPGDLVQTRADWIEAARVSMNNRTDESTGWGMAQRINTWARLRDGNRAYKLIGDLFGNGMYKNLWDAHPPFQIDGNFGYTSGVAEMLMQSNMGFIDLFPALPDAWASGSYSGLVARGNFELSAQWSGKVATRVEILSKNGGECVVSYPNLSGAKVTDSDGNSVSFTADGDKITFNTTKGKTYTITGIPGKPVSVVENLTAYRIADDTVELRWDAETGETYQVYRQVEGGDLVAVAGTPTVSGSVASLTDNASYAALGDITYAVAVSGKAPSTAVSIKDLRNMTGMIDDRDSRITYSAGWSQYGGDADNYDRTSTFIENSKGTEYLEFTFLGTGIEVYVRGHNHHGDLDITIDGGAAERVPVYTASTSPQHKAYEKTDLDYGVHTIRVKARGDYTSPSNQAKIEFDAFKVLDASVVTTPETLTISAVGGIERLWAAGDTVQFTANLPGVAWSMTTDYHAAASCSSANQHMAALSDSGLLTAGKAAETVTVTATLGGQTASKTITISPDPVVTIVEDSLDGTTPNPAITWSGSWSSYDGEPQKHHGGSKTETRGNDASYSYSYSFTGTGTAIFVQKNGASSWSNNSYSVKLDDETPVTCSGYDSTLSTAGVNQQKLIEFLDLANTTHTITVVGSGNGVNLDFIEVYVPNSDAPSVDLTALKAAVGECAALDQSSYSVESWAVLEQALNDAAGLLNGTTTATSENVAAAIQAITTAKGNLLPKSLSAPTGLTVISRESSAITLKWNAVDGADSYSITVGDGAPIENITDTVYRVTGLTSGQTYTFSVKAVNTGSSSAAATVDGTTLETEAPTTVTNLAWNSGTNTISWTAANDDVGVTGYKVFVNGTAETDMSADTSRTLSLTTAGQYTIQVIAMDAAGNESVPAVLVITLAYTVTFDSKGGSTVTSQGVAENGKATEPDDPTKDNADFGGWYKDENYTDEYDFDTPVTENITLYAKWTPKQYTVTFDTQNGEDPTTQRVDYDSTVTKPTDPTKGNAEFGGWYTDAGCTTAWDFDTDTVTDNITLYAKWTPEQYTVTFDTQNGEDPTTQRVDYDSTVTKPADPTKDNAEFGGWYRDSECTTAYDFDTPVTENITLYAKWTAAQQSSGGGSVIVSPIPGGDTTPTPTTTTTTTTNPDGTTTTTVTDKETGTVTETTEKKDGTVEIKETQKDGTVTETTKNTDGSTEMVETKPDGTVTETNTDAEGAKVEKVTDPEKNVAITVTDPEGEVLAQVELPAEIPAPETRFEDVPEGHWADQAIHSMAAMEVVKGVGDDRFDMDGDMTRGALATVLSRLSNGQEGLESSFTDVAADEWYADGIAWAAKTGIVTGYSETEFGPNDIITREQLAVMLCRYARLLGMDTTADSAELDSFNDGSSTHDWAADSIAWCVANGILRGMGNETLAPTATATRAQVAVMLQRFMDLMK